MSSITITPIMLRVSIRSVFGLPKIYPENPAAQAIADIARTRTISPEVLRTAVKGLGAGVEFASSYGDEEKQLRRLLEAS